jgi:hypothetical protein
VTVGENNESYPVPGMEVEMVSGVVDGEISRAMILALSSDTQRIPPLYLLGQESSCSTMYQQN